MKKNNNILKLFAVTFMAMGSVSQVCAMDDISIAGSVSVRSVSVSGMSADGLEPQAHFERVKASILQGQVLQLCTDLFDRMDGTVTIETILSSVSRETGGTAAEDVSRLNLHRTIVNAVVLGAVTRLGEYRNPNDPKSLFVVGRLISFLLLDSHIQTDHAWLSGIRIGDDPSKHAAFTYLMGGADEPGVISISLGDITKSGNITHDVSLEEISLAGLSNMFFAAAEVFPEVLHDTYNTYNRQSAFLEAFRTRVARESRIGRGFITQADFDARQTIRIFGGMRTTYSMLDVLNEAVKTVELRKLLGKHEDRVMQLQTQGVMQLQTQGVESRVPVKNSSPVQNSSWFSSTLKYGAVLATGVGVGVFGALKLLKK